MKECTCSGNRHLNNNIKYNILLCSFNNAQHIRVKIVKIEVNNLNSIMVKNYSIK